MNQVTEFTGDEGGHWQVWTQGSSYLVDLEAMTITRIPGPDSSSSINDHERPLCILDICRVGAAGYWTMHAGADSDSVEFFWQICTEIRRIERLPEENS